MGVRRGDEREKGLLFLRSLFFRGYVIVGIAAALVVLVSAGHAVVAFA